MKKHIQSLLILLLLTVSLSANEFARNEKFSPGSYGFSNLEQQTGSMATSDGQGGGKIFYAFGDRDNNDGLNGGKDNTTENEESFNDGYESDNPLSDGLIVLQLLAVAYILAIGIRKRKKLDINN